mgnify:FL=1
MQIILLYGLISAWEQVYIHVYKLKDSDLGFYHTGIELYGSEFTYCQVLILALTSNSVSIAYLFFLHIQSNKKIMAKDRGIVRHRPRKCDWGQFLGSINLA